MPATKTNARNGFPEPQWFTELTAAYSNGETQAFVLHLNVKDYVVPGIHLTPYLCKMLSNRKIIAIYNRSEGITFPIGTMRDKFMEVLGLQQQAAPATDAARAALGKPAGQQSSQLPKEPSAALPLLERLLKASVAAAVIVEYTETLLPPADIATMSPDDRTTLVTLSRWGTDKAVEGSGNLAILATDNLANLHPALRSASNNYKAIEIPLPDRMARQSYIEWELEVNPLNMEMDANQLANGTAGLSLVHIENIFLQARPVGRLTWQMVRQRKSAIIETEYAGLLEVLDPTAGFEVVGGMEQLKAWARNEVIAPVREGRTQDTPQGVLLAGPPGTGKTYFVRALAKEIGFNAVAFNPGEIQAGTVGATERNMSRVFSVIRSLAPTLVFMDEIDQSDVSARGNSSGNPVAKNLFSMMLRFMSDPDNRGRVIFFMASNRPDLIDPALLRFGRVDVIAPVLLGEAEERGLVAAVQAKAQGVTIAADALKLIATDTEKYSNSDVAAVVTKARKVSAREARTNITVKDARAALCSIRPATLRNADYYTMLAVDACNDTELLPKKYADLLNDRASLKEKIQAASPEPTIRGKREL